MKRFTAVILFILIVVSYEIKANNWLPPPRIQSPKNSFGIMAGFSQGQMRLWQDFLRNHKNYQPNINDVVVFDAITQALEHTRLSRWRNALSLVKAVDSIHGEIPGAPSAQQFNIGVRWTSTAPKELQYANFGFRIGWGHVGEWGMSYKSESHGLHVLFQKSDFSKGHVHIDYRSFALPNPDREGHYEPYNADVRAIGPQLDFRGKPIDNFLRHQQWFGAIPNYIR